MNYCTICGQHKQATGHVCFAGELSNKPSTHQYGWECPRCHRIHSPLNMSCDCQPGYFTGLGTTSPGPNWTIGDPPFPNGPIC